MLLSNCLQYQHISFTFSLRGGKMSRLYPQLVLWPNYCRFQHLTECITNNVKLFVFIQNLPESVLYILQWFSSYRMMRGCCQVNSAVSLSSHKMAAKTLYDLQLVPHEEHLSDLLAVTSFVFCFYCMLSTLCSLTINTVDLLKTLIYNFYALGISVSLRTVHSVRLWILCVSIVINWLKSVLLK